MNPKHSQITMYCSFEHLGNAAYLCEGTKAFARCFPLLAASISFVVVARFVLQSRLYYIFLMKKVLIDFHNWRIWKDFSAVLLAICFLLAMMHFVLDFCYPPYLLNSPEKITKISMFVGPCLVFFAVFERGCNIERQLVTLNQFYEDDVAGARQHLQDAQVCKESAIKVAIKQFMENMETRTDDEFHLDHVIQTMADSYKLGQAADETVHVVASSGSFRSRIQKAGLFRGLWPGRFLLDKRLTDEASTTFRRMVRVFLVIFGIVQLAILQLLLTSVCDEVNDVFRWVPSITTLTIAGEHYNYVGQGYCRDAGMEQPHYIWAGWNDTALLFTDFHQASSFSRHHDSRRHTAAFLATDTNDTLRRDESRLAEEPVSDTRIERIRNWISSFYPKRKVEPRAHLCAKHCNLFKACLGFAEDPRRCTIYTSKPLPLDILPNWIHSPAETVGLRRTVKIVQSNNVDTFATCYKSAKPQSKPQDIVGAVVSMLHLLMVVWILISMFVNMWCFDWTSLSLKELTDSMRSFSLTESSPNSSP